MADDLDDDEHGSPTSVDIKEWRAEKKARAQAEARVKELEDEIATQARDKALSSTDLAALSDKQRQALAKVHDGDFTADALKQTAIDLGWLDDTEQQQIDDELDRSEKVTQAAETGRTSRTTGALTPAIVSGWSADRTMRFEKEHPEAMDQILRGNEVTGIAF